MSTPTSSLPSLALARNLDLSSPSNQLAVGGSLASLLLARLTGQSWAGSLRAGLGAFTAWAAARELDPDHEESAAAALAAEALLGLTDPAGTDLGALEELLAAAVVMASLRTLSATVGTPPLVAEQAALAAGALAAGTTGQHAAALAPGAALLLSHTRNDDLGPQDPWTGAGAFAAALLPAFMSAPGSSKVSAAASLAALVLSPAALHVEEVSSRSDLDTDQISKERVKSSRLMAAGVLGLGLLTGGSRGLRPLAAACAGVGFWALVSGRG